MGLIDRVSQLCARGGGVDALTKEFSQLLRASVAHYNWVGVYRVEGKELVLKGWDGPAATEHVRIPIGQGICGLAAREDRTVVVDDVTKDARYLQCFLHTKSEIVVPIRRGGKVVGEIDIDSDRPAAFNAADAALLEWCAERLAEAMPPRRKRHDTRGLP